MVSKSPLFPHHKKRKSTIRSLGFRLMGDNTAIIYSHQGDTKAVAYLDILGFGDLTGNNFNTNFENVTYWSFVNAILFYKNSMLQEFPRDIPYNESAPGHRNGFWYKHVPMGAINFVIMSDSVVLYGQSLKH